VPLSPLRADERWQVELNVRGGPTPNESRDEQR
jgi:hypothetical protein